MRRQKYVPLDKQSKRKKKEYNTAQRRDWGEINPVTRKTPNLKVYNRKKIGQRCEYEPMSDLLIMCRVSSVLAFPLVVFGLQ